MVTSFLWLLLAALIVICVCAYFLQAPSNK